MKKGDYNLDIIFENKNAIVYKISDYLKLEQKGTNSILHRKIQHILFDKQNTKATFLQKLQNDYLGQNISNKALNILNINNYKFFIQEIDAITMLEIIDKIKNNPDLEIKIRDQILKLEQNLSENDNPVLLIGKIKENIKL